jgi:hypothetical protein
MFVITSGMTFITVCGIVPLGVAYNIKEEALFLLEQASECLKQYFFTLKISVSWEVTPRSVAEIYRRFVRSYCCHRHQGRLSSHVRGGVSIS